MSKKLSMAEKMQAGAAAREKLVGPDPEPTPAPLPETKPDLHVVSAFTHEDAEPTAKPSPFAVSTDYVNRTLHLQQSTLDAFDDWADGQRRKRRKKKLKPGEPGNVQQCADHVLRLGLQQLGALKNNRVLQRIPPVGIRRQAWRISSAQIRP